MNTDKGQEVTGGLVARIDIVTATMGNRKYVRSYTVDNIQAYSDRGDHVKIGGCWYPMANIPELAGLVEVRQ